MRKQRLLFFSFIVLILFYCVNPVFISSTYAFSNESKNNSSIIDVDLLKDMSELGESYIGNNSFIHFLIKQVKPEVMMSAVSYDYEKRLNDFVSLLENEVLNDKDLRRDLNINTNPFECIRDKNNLLCSSERVFFSLDDLILDFTQNEINLKVEDKKIIESVNLRGSLEQNNRAQGRQFSTDISIGCSDIYHYDNEKGTMEFEVAECYVGLGQVQLMFNVKAGLISRDMIPSYIDILDIYYIISNTPINGDKSTETNSQIADISMYFDSFSLQLKSKNGLLNGVLSLVNNYRAYANLPLINKAILQEKFLEDMREFSFNEDNNDEFSQLIKDEIIPVLYRVIIEDNQEVSLRIYPNDKPYLFNVNDNIDFDYIMNKFFDYYNIKLRSDK